MMGGDETIRALRKALEFSPDNLPLLQHLADCLLAAGRPEEAEVEYRRALALSAGSRDLELGLATSFYRQGKDSQALTIVEHLVAGKEPPARAYVLHARLLLRSGDVPLAVLQYRTALDLDPAAYDPDLSEQLGVQPGREPGDLSSPGAVVDGKVRVEAEDSESAPPQTIERPATSFQDVGGMESLKEEIRMKIIFPLTNPDLFRAYGKPIGGGILMYGPPGCGKTHLARATAGEIRAGFLSVGIHEVLDIWLGRSERNLHELFDQARRNTPCVLFFDEVDALGASRADMRQSSGRQIINQFLAELDGVQDSNEGVLILAATNAPWHLDSAFRRPGRFDRVLFVPPPDAAARAAILRIICRGKPVGEIDFDALARKTEHLSGADLKAVVDVAVEAKLREAMKAGTIRPLGTKDLLAAVGALKPTTREWFATARNYALYSNQGGIYDDILKHLKM